MYCIYLCYFWFVLHVNWLFSYLSCFFFFFQNRALQLIHSFCIIRGLIFVCLFVYLSATLDWQQLKTYVVMKCSIGGNM